METDQEASPTPRDRWWSTGLVALLVIPLAVSAGYLWFSVGDSYLPNTDWAVFELRARDVFDQAVLVGPYSRYGWNHPGPLLFYVLGGFYKLTGSRSISLFVTALLVNGAALVLIGWVAFRRGRLPMVIATVVPVVLMTHALGADLLRNPWNPYVPILPLLLLLFLCWSVAVGDLWMLPIATAVASFAIQSHVGLALAVAAFVLVALVGLVVRAIRTPRDERREWWVRVAKVVGVSAVVFALLWFPVFWGAVVRGDGNLRKLVDFFTSEHETAGLARGLEALGLVWGPRPEWMFGLKGSDVLGAQQTEPHWWLAIGLGLGVLATVVAVRRRSFAIVWLAGLLAVAFPVAVLAVSNVVGALYAYLTRWTWVLGAALGTLVLWGVWLAVPPGRRPGVLRVATPVAVLVVAVLAVLETVDAIDAGTPLEPAQAGERVITREVLANLPPGDGPVLVDTSKGGLMAPGIVLALERRGIPTRVSPPNAVVYGPERAGPGGPFRAELLPVFGPEEIERLDPPGPRIAHFVKPGTPEFRRRVQGLLRDARALPPGPRRTAYIEVLERARHGPELELAVYLKEPPR